MKLKAAGKIGGHFGPGNAATPQSLAERRFVAIGGRRNLCSVTFKDSKLARAGFFAALTDGWTLASRFDVTDQDSRDEMYSVAGIWPNELVLQMLSTRAGTMTSLTLLAAL